MIVSPVQGRSVITRQFPDLRKALVMRKETTEEKILSAATELFVRNGFHGTSIDDIMSKVGLTKGAFYSHFDSKDQLFMKLIDEYRFHFIGGLTATIDEKEGNALERLHRVMSFLSKFALENSYLCFLLTFLTTELNTNVDFEPALRRIYLDYQKIISNVIRQGQKQRLFKKWIDPELTALTFMAVHDGVLHQWMLHRQYIDGEAFVRTFRDIFISGVVSAEAIEQTDAGAKTRTRVAS